MKHLHLQAPLLQVHAVHIGDLQLSPIGGNHVLGELHRAVVVEIEARDRIIRLGMLGFFLDGEGASLDIELDYTEALRIVKNVIPTDRGELEITDVNRMYLEEGSLEVKVLHRGSAWLDTGTIPSLYKASEFVKAVEDNQGLQIAALEEIAYNNGWITKEVLLDAAERHAKTAYGQHLLRVAENRILFGNMAS